MPFVGRTTGGAWPSGGTTVTNCDASQQSAILAAINFVLVTSGKVNAVRAFGGELVTLADKLAAKNMSNINIDCSGSECTPGKLAYSVFNGDTTTFCGGSLPPMSQGTTNSTLFHELVHQCGGIELDAWSLEETFFTGIGYSRGNPPQARYCDTVGTDPGIEVAGSGLRQGTFVVWNPQTGEVFTKVLSGGSWPSAPTPTPAMRLLGPDRWWMCNDL